MVVDLCRFDLFSYLKLLWWHHRRLKFQVELGFHLHLLKEEMFNLFFGFGEASILSVVRLSQLHVRSLNSLGKDRVFHRIGKAG
jgi:hypothetical protein